MQVSRADLWWAASRGVIGREQVEPLWQALAERGAERGVGRQSFDLPHLAYYFGALGVFGYVGHLAYRVFQGSLLFPFVLTIIGVGVIFLGVQYQRRRPAIERAILGLFPAGARRLLPPSRG